MKSPRVHVSWKEMSPHLANLWQLAIFRIRFIYMPRCLETAATYSHCPVNLTVSCHWLCVQGNTVFYGSYYCQILTPLKQATALCVSIDPTCAKPEWICGSHKMCSHPQPTLEIKVSYLSQLLMEEDSSNLTSQTTTMVAGHCWGSFAHKEHTVTFSKLDSYSVPHTLPFYPPCPVQGKRISEQRLIRNGNLSATFLM